MRNNILGRLWKLKLVREKMINFKNDTNYTFGVLSANSTPTDLNPIFKQNTQRMTLSGKKLKELGIKSFEEFLESPECTFKATDTVCVFEDIFDDTGYSGYKLIGRGNPIKTNRNYVAEQQMGLNDSVIGPQMEHNNGNRDVIRMFQQQVESLNNQLTALQSEYSKSINKNILAQQEAIKKIGDLETEKHKLTIEVETLKGLLDKYSVKENGLNDAVTAGLAGLMNNPVVGNVIGNILGGIAGKFIPMPSQNVEQPLPEKTEESFPHMQGVM